MNLKDLLAISGQSGLFKFVSQGRNGVIVENIENKKRMNVPSTAKMSSLEDIALYTDDEEMPLSKVFDDIFAKENGGVAIDTKSDNEKLKNYLAEVLPTYDREKVYVSDIRKLVNWYNILHQNNMLIKEEAQEEAKEEPGDSEVEQPKETVKAAKKGKPAVKKNPSMVKSAEKPMGQKPTAKGAQKRPSQPVSKQK